MGFRNALKTKWKSHAGEDTPGIIQSNSSQSSRSSESSASTGGLTGALPQIEQGTLPYSRNRDAFSPSDVLRNLTHKIYLEGNSSNASEGAFDNPCATDIVVPYDAPPLLGDSNLLQQLHLLDPLETCFPRLFKASRQVSAQVGACASDLVWRRSLKQIEVAAPTWYEDDDEQTSPAVIKSKIRDTVKNWSFTMPNLDMGSRSCNVTPKFLQLLNAIKSFEPQGVAFRGVVFGKANLQIL